LINSITDKITNITKTWDYQLRIMSEIASKVRLESTGMSETLLLLCSGKWKEVPFKKFEINAKNN